MQRLKFEYFRSEKHRRNVAALDCMSCGRGGPSQCAHSNLAVHGKGRGIKAGDQFAAALCPRCHEAVDSSYALTRSQREEMWVSAHIRTVAALKLAGLWPAELGQ